MLNRQKPRYYITQHRRILVGRIQRTGSHAEVHRPKSVVTSPIRPLDMRRLPAIQPSLLNHWTRQKRYLSTTARIRCIRITDQARYHKTTVILNQHPNLKGIPCCHRARRNQTIRHVYTETIHLGDQTCRTVNPQTIRTR